MYTFALTVLLFAFACAEPVQYKDCGSVEKINSVEVSPCPAEPCPFKQNTNQTIHINFTSTVDSKGAKNDIHGIIAGVPVPFPVPDDCCSNNNTNCPIKKGALSDYNLVVFVSPTYPRIRLLIKLEVQGDDGKDLLCIIFPAVIVA